MYSFASILILDNVRRSLMSVDINYIHIHNDLKFYIETDL